MAGNYRCGLEPQPLPFAAQVPGLKLTSDLDFGTLGNVRTLDELDVVAKYTDAYGTPDNGGHYGTAMSATKASTVMPGVGQVVDASTRSFTAEALQMHVRPKTASQTTVGPASAHNALNGSFTLKYELPKAGAQSGQDLVWESRFRVAKSVNGFWLAIWASGTKWQTGQGPEMDVMESFSSPYNTPTDMWGWHTDQVGVPGPQAPQNCVNDWPACLNPWKALGGAGKLDSWHTWTWVYKRDDTWVQYLDGLYFASGKLAWTNTSYGPQNMQFMYDCGLGQTQLWQVSNITLPVSALPLTCELDYSRIWVKQ